MENVKRFKTTLIVAGVLLLIALILVGIFLQSTPQMLYPEQIRDYQGENLSSIADVRENAIAGTQNINESTYRLTVTGLVNKTLELTYDDVVNGYQKYQKVVTLYCIEG